LPPAPDPGKERANAVEIARAASEFESLLVAQLLKSMRESGDKSGWMGTGEDATADSVMELAEQQFAKVVAERGGLGLARMVSRGLSRETADKER